MSGGRQAGKSNQANFSTTYTGQGSVRKRVLTSSDSQNTSSTPYRKETHFAVPAVLALSRRCSPLNTVNSGHFARETTVSLPIRVRLVVLTCRELKVVATGSSHSSRSETTVPTRVSGSMERSTDTASAPDPTDKGECGVGVVARRDNIRTRRRTSRCAHETGVTGVGVCVTVRELNVWGRV